MYLDNTRNTPRFNLFTKYKNEFIESLKLKK